MGLLSFLLRYSKEIRYSRAMVAVAIFAGIASGLMNTALLALINSMLSRNTPTTTVIVWSFMGLCLALPLTRFVSEVLLLRLTQGTMYGLRMHLCRRILSVPLRHLENLGTPRLLATLTEDIPSVTNALVTLPLLCMHSAVVVGCLVYLGWLSSSVLLSVLGFMVVGIISYQLPVMKALGYLRRGREEWDALIKHFRSLTEGVKELKLHRHRREAFLEDVIGPTATSLRRHNFVGNAIYIATRSWGQILFFILIGFLFFVLPRYQNISLQTMTGYIIILLYMMTPLEVILNTLPILGRANIAMQKIDKLGLSLANQPDDSVGKLEGNQKLSWERVDLVGVTHVYHREGEDSQFTLGPIDLSFYPGELVFLAGGNGSGKTTLARLLTGLYIPDSGEIRLNGQVVDNQTREHYRQHFSVVFSDFYLFDTLLGLEAPELDAQALHYLERLQLNHRVQVKDGKLSTIELSQGQRKRLALLTAYLEDRPFYIFDEWAADQDPLFKDVFYLYLLQELKARGKTVLVITHDDRYYHVADRLIKLNYGKIEFDEPVTQLNGIPLEVPSAR